MARDDKVTIYVMSGDRRIELPYCETKIEVEWLLRHPLTIEKAIYDNDEDIYSYRQLGDRYFMTVDDPDYVLFGEPTLYQYWLFNVDEEHSIVVGESSTRLNFNEVSKANMTVIFQGHDEDYCSEFKPDIWGE